jgi:hypothetical protein
LALTKEEKAIIHPTGEHKDKYDIKWNFIGAVAKFCDCDVWHHSKNGFTFCGQRSDIDFAIWLADHLANFVRGELTNYLAKTIIPPYQRRRMINGFVIGCGTRISHRLEDLIAQSRDKQRQAPAGASRALVLAQTKQAAVIEAMKCAGIKLRSVGRRRATNADSFAAGRLAGDRATFARPLGGTPSRRRLA